MFYTSAPSTPTELQPHPLCDECFTLPPRLPHGQSVTSILSFGRADLSMPWTSISGVLWFGHRLVERKMCVCTECGVSSGTRVAIRLTCVSTFEVRVPKQTFEILMSVSPVVKLGFWPFAVVICITNFTRSRIRFAISQ